jgi:hypothetical protein
VSDQEGEVVAGNRPPPQDYELFGALLQEGREFVHENEIDFVQGLNFYGNARRVNGRLDECDFSLGPCDSDGVEEELLVSLIARTNIKSSGEPVRWVRRCRLSLLFQGFTVLYFSLSDTIATIPTYLVFHLRPVVPLYCLRRKITQTKSSFEC